MKHLKFFLSIILLFTVFQGQSKAEDTGLRVIYFFSATCPHCKEVYPYIVELNKIIKLEGVLLGNASAGKLAFDYKKGVREDAMKYGLRGVPSMVILRGSDVIQILRGSGDIKHSAIMFKGFKRGALGVSEAIQKKPENDFLITGWIIKKRTPDNNIEFFITDKKSDIKLLDWKDESHDVEKPVLLKVMEKDSGLQVLEKNNK